MKKTLKTIRNLSAGLSWRMFRALLSQPHLLLPTAWATVESILFAELYFKESHSGQGVANAFRHAAWNVLIAKNCSIFTSEAKALSWAKFTTDLHEECFPNEDFDREMDLHNNALGRKFFVELRQQKVNSKKKMMDALVEKSKSAVGLEDEQLFVNHLDEMVFLLKK